MSSPTPTRDEALALLREYNRSESLVHHALAVEGVMRHLARKAGADEDAWGLTGLVHDLDYERFPEQHCRKSAEILTERGWPKELIRAVVSHGWEICADVEPRSPLEKTLYVIDELTGFVTACALVRPSRSVLDLEVSSVRKKWKQKGFAAGANRDVIAKGAQMLDVGLDSLIGEVIEGMRTVADAIGLGMKTPPPSPSEGAASRPSMPSSSSGSDGAEGQASMAGYGAFQEKAQGRLSNGSRRKSRGAGLAKNCRSQKSSSASQSASVCACAPGRKLSPSRESGAPNSR